MDEVPDRPVVDLETTLGEFDDEPPQREVPLLGPLQKPDTVLTRNRLRLVPAHLARRDTARLPQAPHPSVRSDAPPHQTPPSPPGLALPPPSPPATNASRPELFPALGA